MWAGSVTTSGSLSAAAGVVYVNPRPDAKARDVFYSFENPEDYRFVQDWFVECADLQRPTWQQFLRAMSRYRISG